MRKPNFIAVGLALLASCASINVVQPKATVLPAVDFPTRVITYPSGLRVAVERDAGSKLAGLFLVVGSGSTSDPIGKEGLAHYVQHLTFRARPEGRETFAELLDEAGAIEHNGATSLDSTSFYEIGLGAHLPELLRLEAGRMADPLGQLTAAERDTELEVVRNELRWKGETGYLGEAVEWLQAALFPAANGYSRPVIGTHASLSAIRREDAEAFARAAFRPDNLTLYVMGDVDLGGAEKWLAEALPAQLREAVKPVVLRPRLPARAPPLPAEPPANPTLLRKEAGVAAPELWIGWTLPGSYGAEARLLPELVARKLINASNWDDDINAVTVGTIEGAQATLLFCDVQLREGRHPEDSLQRVLDEMPDLWTNLGDAESAEKLAAAKLRTVVAELERSQSLVYRGTIRAEATHFRGDPQFVANSLRALRGRSPAELAALAESYVTPERARAVLFVPRVQTAGPVPAATRSLESAPTSLTPALPPGWEKTRLQELLDLSQEPVRYRLDNGLQVVLQKRPGFPLISASAIFPAAPDDRQEAAAAAATKRWSLESREWANGDPKSLGAALVTGHGLDHSVYSISGLATHAESLLAMLAETLQTAGMSRTEWAVAWNNAVPALEREEQESQAIAARKLREALLDGSPYALSFHHVDLDTLAREDVNRWIGKSRAPGNATLAITGDFDLEEMKKWVAQSFAEWSGDLPAPPDALSVEPGDGQVSLLVTPSPGATQASLQFGCLFSSPATASADRLAGEAVLAQLLQRRLRRRLRDQLGATYDASAARRTLLGGTSTLSITSAVDSAQLSPVLAAISSALASLRDGLPEDSEVAWAKVRVASRLAASRITNAGETGYELRRSLDGTGSGITAQLGAVTAAQVHEALQGCLKTRPTLSIVGDEEQVRAAFQASWQAP